jgi:hypothetical protein
MKISQGYLTVIGTYVQIEGKEEENYAFYKNHH